MSEFQSISPTAYAPSSDGNINFHSISPIAYARSSDGSGNNNSPGAFSTIGIIIGVVVVLIVIAVFIIKAIPMIVVFIVKAIRKSVVVLIVIAGFTIKAIRMIAVFIFKAAIRMIAVFIFKAIQKSKMRQANGNVNVSQSPIQNSTNANPTMQRSGVSGDSEIDVTSIEKFLSEFQRDRPIRFTPEHLMNFTSNYSERLGSGCFGVVYKGQFPNGMLVAIKVLNGTSDKRAEEQFMAEVGTIGRTYHVNLIRLYGFCFDAKVKALVYEYMENGSLDNHLFDKKSRLEFDKLHEIAVGTAKGIRYLHEECDKKIVHYDIKPGNVLLGKNFCPKVADFGLAKLCNKESSHITLMGARGTPGYAAPELWMPYPVTQKCDVYSFGMLLFEILGRRRNFELGEAESQEWFPRWVWQKFEQGEWENIMSVCEIQEMHRGVAEKLCGVALWCVQYQPEHRPSMNNIVKMLEGEHDIVAPTNPFQYMNPINTASGGWSEGMSGSTRTSTGKNECESSNLLQS